jgi:hypothetical protein
MSNIFAFSLASRKVVLPPEILWRNLHLGRSLMGVLIEANLLPAIEMIFILVYKLWLPMFLNT